MDMSSNASPLHLSTDNLLVSEHTDSGDLESSEKDHVTYDSDWRCIFNMTATNGPACCGLLWIMDAATLGTNDTVGSEESEMQLSRRAGDAFTNG